MYPLTTQAVPWQSRSSKSLIGRPTSSTVVPSVSGLMIRRLSRGMTIQHTFSTGSPQRHHYLSDD